MSRLDEIRAREAKATRGPWAWDSRGDKCHDVQVGLAIDGHGVQRGGFIPEPEADIIYVGAIADITSDDPHADAVFIAHARADLPALLAVAEAAAEYMKVSGPGGQDMARTLGERHWRRELRAALDALGGER